jgi:hypothetical protein
VRRALVPAIAVLAAAACSDSSPVAPSRIAPSENASQSLFSSGTVVVSNTNDDGAGSFRKAIETANGNTSIKRIEFLPRLSTIKLASTVAYTGAQELSIDGNGTTIDGSTLPANATAFLANGGGNLSLMSLTVRKAPAEGVTVQVPASRTGTIKVTMLDLQILDNKGHGVLVNDQVDQSTTDGVQPNADGSAASVEVIVTACKFARNGFSVSDRDGLRVNEGGVGSLTFTMSLSQSEGNAADGVELDERGVGDVVFTMVGTQLTKNGIFDPADLDDGFDVDEYNEGNLVGKLVLTTSSDNYEEGFDFNENNAGDMTIEMSLVEANRNGEEGIDLEEDDDFEGGGNLVATMSAVKANGNKAGDAGVKIREKGVGDANIKLALVEASNNLTTGIQVREGQAGNLVSSIEWSTTNGNTGHGIDHQESSDGDLSGTVSNTTSSGNTGAGVNADESGAGVGAVSLVKVKFGAGNTGGNTKGSATFTVTP